MQAAIATATRHFRDLGQAARVERAVEIAVTRPLVLGVPVAHQGQAPQARRGGHGSRSSRRPAMARTSNTRMGS
jgi:hypothetical protein